MTHDQDELQAEKWDGSEHYDDLNINMQLDADQRMGAFQEGTQFNA
ncbi:MAG: hypothetical protein ACPGYJ_07520 [bacterium]